MLLWLMFFFLSLHHQFEENKVAWVAGLATIGAVEFMAAAVALFILRRLQVAIQNYRLWRHSRWISLVSCYDRRLWLFFNLFKILQTSLRPRTLSRRRLRQHETDMANDPLPSELP